MVTFNSQSEATTLLNTKPRFIIIWVAYSHPKQHFEHYNYLGRVFICEATLRTLNNLQMTFYLQSEATALLNTKPRFINNYLGRVFTCDGNFLFTKWTKWSHKMTNRSRDIEYFSILAGMPTVKFQRAFCLASASREQNFPCEKLNEL